MAKDNLEFKEQQITAIDAIRTIRQYRQGFRVLGEIHHTLTNDIAETNVSGTKDFWNQQSAITPNTIVGIGSISKQFTAATLLKLWDMELTQKHQPISSNQKEWFPQGVDTPINHFMPGLKNRFGDCSELLTRIEADPAYDRITLKDLLNHTHGLGARNEQKAAQLMWNTNESPLSLSEIINVTEKNPVKHIHGSFAYSNFGFDFAAMIIEVVASDRAGTPITFDDAVKSLVLTLYGLNNTHPQSDNCGLYENQQTDIARGNSVDVISSAPSTLEEMNWNTKSNTRAAGGFKSTAEDLTKWATLYMGTTMFENEAVKVSIKDRAGEALADPMHTYHLGIFHYKSDETLGHRGFDAVFSSSLKYDPVSLDVSVDLSVLENLTPYLCKRIISDGYPEDKRLLESFKERLWNEGQKNGYPDLDKDEGKALVDRLLTQNPQEARSLLRYTQLQQHLQQTYSPKELAAQGAAIIRKEIPKKVKAQTVNALDLATQPKNKWTEKMAARQVPGKSQEL